MDMLDLKDLGVRGVNSVLHDLSKSRAKINLGIVELEKIKAML